MQAGAGNPNRGSPDSYRDQVPAGMSEARRGFCQSGYKFSELYECRGTILIVGGFEVKVLLFY